MRAQEYRVWRGHLHEIAALPNVCCKLSGLVTEADWETWTRAQLRPYLDAALESFGPERLMVGSDWPVCTLAASYHEVITLARTLLDARLSASEMDAVFGANAVAAYGLRL